MIKGIYKKSILLCYGSLEVNAMIVAAMIVTAITALVVTAMKLDCCEAQKACHPKKQHSVLILYKLIQLHCYILLLN
jgi:hypothetical protein